jgi:hypothetical protein
MCIRLIDCLRRNSPRCGIQNMPQALSFLQVGEFKADIAKGWNVKNPIRQACECAVVHALNRYFPHEKCIHSYIDLLEKCDYFRESRSHHWRGKGASESESTKEQRWKDLLEDLPGLLEFHNAMLWASTLWKQVTVQHTCDTVSLGVEGKKYANGSGRSVKADCRLQMIRVEYNKPIRARQKKLEEGNAKLLGKTSVNNSSYDPQLQSVLSVMKTSSTLSGAGSMDNGTVNYYVKSEKKDKKINRKEQQAREDLTRLFMNNPDQEMWSMPSLNNSYMSNSPDGYGNPMKSSKRGRKRKDDIHNKKRGRPRKTRPVKMAYDPSIDLVDADAISPRGSLSLQNPNDPSGGLYATDSMSALGFNFGDNGGYPHTGTGSRLARQAEAAGTYKKQYRSYSSTRGVDDEDGSPSSRVVGPLGQPVLSRTRSGRGEPNGNMSARSMSGSEYEMLLLLKQDSNGNSPRDDSTSPRSPRENGLVAPAPSLLDVLSQAIAVKESKGSDSGKHQIMKQHSLDMSITNHGSDKPTGRSSRSNSKVDSDLEFIMSAKRS